VAVGVVAPAQAAPPSAPVSTISGPISNISAQDAERLFRDLGYTSVEVDADGDMVVNMQGVRILVLVGSAKGQYVQMRFAMSGTTATMAKINAWNKSKMYSRAYMDDEGDPVLEAEQDLTGGVTSDRLKDFIKTFGISLTAFLREVT
jgi:hypothetical protein